jgi:CrcB protein
MGLAETAPPALMAPTWLSDVARWEVVVVVSGAGSSPGSLGPARLGVCLAVALGGALGGLARAGAVKLAPVHAGAWPWATFAVNVAGCLILGYVATFLLARRPRAILPLAFAGAGICGALTTFSTLELEIARLSRDGHVGLAGAYAAATLAAGALAIVLSSALARRKIR